MTYPVLQRIERRDRRRRRRQIMRRRITALLIVAAGSVAAVWQLWPVHGVNDVETARAAAAPVHAAGHRARPHVAHRRSVALLGSAAPLLAAHRFTPALSAAAALVADAGTGNVLWASKEHERRPVASTTKILTALVALEHLRPETIVTVDKSVPRVPLVREGLRAGERVPAWKLFYGMLLYSGNDDALAVAIAAAGSRAKFVDLMNDEAKRLGLHDSHFRSPSGVEDVDNYSSAWDLAALTRAALRNSRFRAIVRTKIKRVSWAAPTYGKVYLNHNLLLGSYRGANGVKTGYTSKAGHCLVASATRDGRTLIAVVLDDPNMYVDAKRLLNLGFRNYP
jgi:serine-type D-Ala-D-Ala carboxypeptidase (penicillin-binding protein 5/6)